MYDCTEPGDDGAVTWTVDVTELPVSISRRMLSGVGYQMTSGADSPL